MFPLSRFAQLLALPTVALLLAACGGGSSDKTTTFTIEGRVLNGVLVGSTVDVFGANGGRVLGTATTAADGRFAAEVSRDGPYRLRAKGGKLNGVDYTGTLESSCPAGSGCFVTPYTTVLLRLVDDHGFNHDDAKAQMANSLGFDGDPFLGNVPVEGFDLGAARQAIAGGDGLTAWVDSVVAWATSEDAEPPPGVGGSGPAEPPVTPGDPDPVPPPEPAPDPDPEPIPDPDPEPIVPVMHTVSTTAGPGGRIDPTSRTVSHGATATFTIMPDRAYTIDKVTGCGGSLAGDLYIIGAVNGSCTVTASFAFNTHWDAHSVTATTSTGGGISPSHQFVTHGDVAILTLQRDPGFGIARVAGCGGSRIGDTYTTAPILESCVIEAVFEEIVSFGTSPLNDTGIDWCGDVAHNYDLGDAEYKAMQCEAVTNAGFPGQDGHFGRDALARSGLLPKIGDGAAGFDFTKISNSGMELPASAALGTGPDDWACTRDNVTGLIWEVKVTDSAHLRYQGHIYSWYFPDSPDGNPGWQNGGICVASDCDTTGFVDAVNAQGLCGASDWRVPSRKELQGIVNYGRANFAIDPEYFPNIWPGYSNFWSSSVFAQTEYKNEYGEAWMVALALHFSGGAALVSERHSVGAVRVVRDAK